MESPPPPTPQSFCSRMTSRFRTVIIRLLTEKKQQCAKVKIVSCVDRVQQDGVCVGVAAALASENIPVSWPSRYSTSFPRREYGRKKKLKNENVGMK